MSARSPSAPKGGTGEVVRANLLLVDDQPKNLLALEAILEPLGQNLVRAASGADALKEVLKQDFAVILLDVQMPGMDGFETAQLIKQRSRSQDIPILFLTAISKDDPFVFRGYSVGAVDYLSKPFNPDILRSKVSVFIDLFRKNEKIKQQAELIRESRERDLAELRRTSEQRYRDLAESMPQIVWTANPAGTVTYANRRWWECAGLDPDAHQYDLGEPGADGFRRVLHPDDREAFLAQWQRAIDVASDWEAEFRFGNQATGQYRWHLVRALPVKVADGAEADESGTAGRVRSWIGTSTDIDDRKHAEDALRLLAEASTALAASLGESGALATVAALGLPVLGDACVITLHKDGRVLERKVSLREGDDLGDEDRQKMRAALAEFDDADVVSTLARRVVLDVPHAEGPKGGARARQNVKLAAVGCRSYVCLPIIARDQVFGTMAFFSHAPGWRYRPNDVRLAEDLARRVAVAVDNAQLYAEAQRERAQLADANRAKDEFLAVLSHELRTPLNSMLGWTQIVRAGGLDEKTLARAMETIERNARAQAQLIADLLDVSRIVTGKLGVELRTVSLAVVVEGAIDAARPAASAKGVTLSFENSLHDPEVSGDPDRLQQVAGNLVSNAIKFTPEGGSVVITLDADGGRARLQVRDTGRGIEPAFLPHVFERFRQGEGATTRAHGGLGLGLAIVRHLVDVHRGSVRAASDGPGKGATFIVELPMLVRPSAAPREVAGASEGEGHQLASNALQGIRVLVVEDDDDGRELLEMLLLDYGATVTAVGNAEEALAAVRKGALDILVSDIGLPHEDGYSLLRRVRALPADQGGHIPAIALTAYASGDDRARALAAGFEEHVTKPVEPQELAAAVASLRGVSGRAPTPEPPGVRA